MCVWDLLLLLFCVLLYARHFLPVRLVAYRRLLLWWWLSVPLVGPLSRAGRQSWSGWRAGTEPSRAPTLPLPPPSPTGAACLPAWARCHASSANLNYRGHDPSTTAIIKSRRVWRDGNASSAITFIKTLVHAPPLLLLLACHRPAPRLVLLAPAAALRTSALNLAGSS